MASFLALCFLADPTSTRVANAFLAPSSLLLGAHRRSGTDAALAAFRANDNFRVDLEPPVSDEDSAAPAADDVSSDKSTSWLTNLKGEGAIFTKIPPFIVEDTNLLFYDVALLLNLSVSISFWVVHRLSVSHVGSAVSEGSLLCILWIMAGLYNGAFLRSAVDGHRGGPDDVQAREGDGDVDVGGPKAAGLLGLSTFVGVCNLRIAAALVTAVVEHRPVGLTDGERLIPLEFAVGLVLMSAWRALHSYYSPRI